MPSTWAFSGVFLRYDSSLPTLMPPMFFARLTPNSWMLSL